MANRSNTRNTILDQSTIIMIFLDLQMKNWLVFWDWIHNSHLTMYQKSSLVIMRFPEKSWKLFDVFYGTPGITKQITIKWSILRIQSPDIRWIAKWIKYGRDKWKKKAQIGISILKDIQYHVESHKDRVKVNKQDKIGTRNKKKGHQVMRQGAILWL